MPAINDTVIKAKDRVVELGFYLPLGVYDKVSDAVADVDAKALQNLVADFVERGHSVVAPVERRFRRRTAEVHSTAGDKAADTTRKAARRGAAAGHKATMATPRVATPERSELPIRGYDRRTAEDIVSALDGLTNTDLARVYKYEAAHERRATILDAIDSKMTDLPIATYDALTVSELRGRLNELSKPELRRVRDYEAATKQRKTVLEAIDAKLA
jgi:hypothetical protein